MIINSIRPIFKRDLNKLKQELSLYKNEANIWKTEGTIANTAGNLSLHLVGNLNAFIGAALGNSDYVRNREAEFADKGVERTQLIDMIDRTLDVVDNTLANLKEEQLQQEFPVLVFESKTTTAYMLIHLAVHLGYHLGQINYHRRLLDC